jgi:hypothetical protein
MVLLGDVGQVKVRFGLFRDSVNLGTRLCTVLRRMYHEHGNHFVRTQWYT